VSDYNADLDDSKITPVGELFNRIAWYGLGFRDILREQQARYQRHYEATLILPVVTLRCGSVPAAWSGLQNNGVKTELEKNLPNSSKRNSRGFYPRLSRSLEWPPF